MKTIYSDHEYYGILKGPLVSMCFRVYTFVRVCVRPCVRSFMFDED